MFRIIINTRKKINALVAEDELKKSIHLLSELANEKQKTKITILQSRLTSLDDNNIKGILKEVDFNLERNKLRNAILDCAQFVPNIEVVLNKSKY